MAPSGYGVRAEFRPDWLSDVAPAMRLRGADATDDQFIVEMARLACTIEDRPLPPADDPDVLAMFPGPDDCAIVAVEGEGRRVGAAWWCFHRPVLVEDDAGQPVPEMALAVVPDARGRGIGTELIEVLAREAARTFTQISLNVHLRNPAARLYTRTGFRVAGAGRGIFGVAMRRSLTTDPQSDVQ
jgi:GNAT superfamily N-acetyltransferase